MLQSPDIISLVLKWYPSGGEQACPLHLGKEVVLSLFRPVSVCSPAGRLVDDKLIF